MGKKNKKNRQGIVYSTNPDFEYQYTEESEQNAIDPSEQKLRVWLDRKRRKGKEVTLVTGFEGPEQELKELGRLLKSKCGVGGSVKDGEILIQGNHRDKVLKLLWDAGFRQSKKSGA